MSTEGKTLVDYEGKFLMIELDEHAGELKEYNVEKATPAAVILREKGKTGSELYLADRVLRFEEPAPKAAPPLKARRLLPVEVDKIKRHLVDYHAYKLSDINPLTDQAAAEFHDTLDHKDLDLGHYHGLSKRDQVVAEAESDQSESDESQDVSED